MIDKHQIGGIIKYMPNGAERSNGHNFYSVGKQIDIFLEKYPPSEKDQEIIGTILLDQVRTARHIIPGSNDPLANRFYWVTEKPTPDQEIEMDMRAARTLWALGQMGLKID